MKNWLVTWFKAARAPFLVISLLPCLLGGIIAYKNGSFDGLIFWLATLGIVMAHSAADFIDDYLDYQKGNLGNKVKQFHDSPLISGEVTLKQVWIATAICLFIAFICGLVILLKVGLPVIILVGIGLFIVFFYTAPPFQMNYRGLGETMLFLAFGPMILIGVYYVLARQVTIEPILVSLMPGIFTMNVGVVSNTFDYNDDVRSGKKTLSVRFGQANAVRIIAVTNTLAYLAVILGVVFAVLPVWTLLVLITVPLAYNMLRHARQYGDEDHYTQAMTSMIALSSIATILLIAGYGIQILFY